MFKLIRSPQLFSIANEGSVSLELRGDQAFPDNE